MSDEIPELKIGDLIDEIESGESYIIVDMVPNLNSLNSELTLFNVRTKSTCKKNSSEILNYLTYFDIDNASCAQRWIEQALSQIKRRAAQLEENWHVVAQRIEDVYAQEC